MSRTRLLLRQWWNHTQTNDEPPAKVDPCLTNAMTVTKRLTCGSPDVLGTPLCLGSSQGGLPWTQKGCHHGGLFGWLVHDFA